MVGPADGIPLSIEGPRPFLNKGLGPFEASSGDLLLRNFSKAGPLLYNSSLDVGMSMTPIQKGCFCGIRRPSCIRPRIGMQKARYRRHPSCSLDSDRMFLHTGPRTWDPTSPCSFAFAHPTDPRIQEHWRASSSRKRNHQPCRPSAMLSFGALGSQDSRRPRCPSLRKA